MLQAKRLKIFVVAQNLTSSDLGDKLGVTAAAVDRYRSGSQPSEPVKRLLQQLWPEWWPFLTGKSNTIPSLQTHREAV